MTWGKGRLKLEQLAAQDASQAKDARTEQHDAAGLRNRGTSGAGGGAGGAGAAAAENREGFRRDRTNGVFRSLRGAGVLIPVNWVAAGDAGVLQVQPIAAGVERRAVERGVLLADVVAVLVGGAGALREVDSLIKIAGTAVLTRGDRQFSRGQSVAREQPHSEAAAGDGGVVVSDVECVANDKAEVD